MLLVMHYMYIPAFIVTSAAISQLWVYLCYLLIYTMLLEGGEEGGGGGEGKGEGEMGNMEGEQARWRKRRER